MNSSGIKRGLAATAVAALAVTGLPFLASSASAVQGDSASVAYVGPVRNGGEQGGLVVLKTVGLTAGDLANLKLAGTNGVPGDQNNSVQSANIVQTAAVPGNNGPDGLPGTPDDVAAIPAQNGTFTADDKTNEFGGKDGFDEIAIHVSSLTNAAGDPVHYVAFVDDNTNNKIDVGEAKVAVDTITAGAPTNVSISPVSQVAALNQDSDKYTVAITDSNNRPTQLRTGEQVVIGKDADTSLTPAAINNATYERGVAQFAAQASTAIVHDITATGPDTDPGAGVTQAKAAATLKVLDAVADLTKGSFDIVSGADTWDGFGGDGSGTGIIRTDQKSFTMNIKAPTASDAKKAVTLTLTGGGGVTFDGGKATKTVTTVLDENGLGSFTVTPDASSIADAGTIGVTGAGLPAGLTLTYQNSKVTEVAPTAKTYVAKFGGTVPVTVQVLDQFGNPALGTFVTVTRTGANAAAESAKVPVDSAGNAVFNLTDTKAQVGGATEDTLAFAVYAGQYATTPLTVATNPGAKIKWTTDGLGEDFTALVDGTAITASSYDAKDHFANPLTDAHASNGAGDSTDEFIPVTSTGGTTGAAMTVAVNHGALVLGADDSLAKAKPSKTGYVGDTFKIIGTKTGVVDVTITSGGRTKTTQVTIQSLSDLAAATTTTADDANGAPTARNVVVTGPEKAVANDVVTFTAVVTDAFGNPVMGVPASKLTTSVSGPAGAAEPQALATDKNGVLEYQVELDNGADSPVTLRLAADKTFAQFGALADELNSSKAKGTNSAVGLLASDFVSVAKIANVIDLDQLQAAVDAAQAKVDTAQDNLDAAKGDLAVAKAERSVAQKAVKSAKKDLRQAKKHHKGVKAARKALREARGDLRVANAKVSVAQVKVNTATERLAAAQAELDAAKKALEDAQK